MVSSPLYKSDTPQFSIDYLSVESIRQMLQDAEEQVLLLVSPRASHDHNLQPFETTATQISCGLSAVDQPYVEIWRTNETITRGCIEFETVDALSSLGVSCNFGKTNHVMMVALTIDDLTGVDLSQISQDAYTKILAVFAQHGYNKLYRTWNFLQDINVGDSDQECYKQFCLGRHNAFRSQSDSESANIAAESSTYDWPAATAIGSHQKGMVIYALAGKVAGLPIENPRQVSAYHYPRQYGPKSPSFARALVANLAESVEPKAAKHQAEQHLFISGTASVVGHESVHQGDIVAQTEETLHNIEVLFQQAIADGGWAAQQSSGTWRQPASMKVYLRDSADHAQVKALLDQQLQVQNPIMYLRGDICRQELLIEIEAVYSI